ncbi:MAG TPA: hypothetical protein [Caudoviricetes sp.]|nr:MAG TPA: hypothetical protein [Caudoviricetes sp.]
MPISPSLVKKTVFLKSYYWPFTVSTRTVKVLSVFSLSY